MNAEILVTNIKIIKIHYHSLYLKIRCEFSYLFMNREGLAQ